MNIFRLTGDLVHAFAVLYLSISILSRKSYAGISARTQLLLCMVFITRYLDLTVYFVSYYNLVMKIFFISLTVFTYLMSHWYPDVSKHDNSRSELLVFVAMMTAVLNNYQFVRVEVLWAFSEYLEAIAIAPQINLILRTKRITNPMKIYFGAMLTYKSFYVLNWIYRYETTGYLDSISDFSGVLFIALYILGLILMLSCKVKTQQYGAEDRIKKNIFARTMIPSIFSISSNVGPGGRLGPDGTPLVKDNEIAEKERQLLEKI